jgi:hypothetical protein
VRVREKRYGNGQRRENSNDAGAQKEPARCRAIPMSKSVKLHPSQ